MQIILTSFLILYLELSLIRFLPAHILYLGFFTNFVLISSFLGIGLGFLLGKIKFNLINFFPAFLLLLVVMARLFSSGLDLRSNEVIFFSDLSLKQPIALPPYFLIPFIFLFVALTFIPLGQYLGRFFANTKNPLKIYTLDILGSILGILVFFFLSFLGLPAFVWFILFSVLFLLLRYKDPRIWLSVFILVLVIFVTSDIGTKGDVSWSPYYKITATTIQGVGGNILVNNIHQQFFSKLNRAPLYNLIFSQLQQINALGDILIIGSGSGQDVNAALNFGAKHIDAVEIDPVILKIGKDLHPDQPYSDPRVTIYNDDGRNFLRNTNKKYDLIIFALTDSLVLNSGFSDIRLESYLFTTDAFKEARNHLNPNGLFVLYNYYRKDWLINRIEKMLHQMFPENAQSIRLSDTFRVFLAGRIQSQPKVEMLTEKLPSDDWPFIYLQKPGIPFYYLSVLFVVFLISAASILFVKRKFLKHSNLSPRRFFLFFFLGAAFSLIETKSIVQLNLLFGVTWVVNAIAFSGILLSVLVAILFTFKYKIKQLWIPGLLLLISLGAQYAIPVSNLLSASIFTRLLLAIPYFYLPIFFSNLLFANIFSSGRNCELNFGSNLLGLVFGGFIEYIALISGYSFLTVIAGIFYLFALLSMFKLPIDR